MCFFLIANEECFEAVEPSERAFIFVALSVDFFGEMAFSAAFGVLAVALVFANIGYEVVVPEHFAECFGVEAGVGAEVRIAEFEAIFFALPKDIFGVLGQSKAVVMIAGEGFAVSDDMPPIVNKYEQIGRFGTLSPLIRNFFAPFFAMV